MKAPELANKLAASDVPHASMGAKTVLHFWNNVDLTGSTQFAAPPENHIVNYRPPRHLDKKFHNQYKRGAQIFQRESHCATCHMTNGQGNGIVYPTLVGSPWVTGSEERLVKLALHGMWGKLTVRGQVYDPARGVPPMTAFRDLLKDDEMADVLTFVRNTWGNKASVIDKKTVAKIRKETKSRSVFWKPEELVAAHPLEKELMQADAVVEVPNNIALEKELLAASAADLAKEAIAKGKASRGKELFYRSAAACSACHDPPGTTARLGPDLTRIATKITNEELVDSLLRPSKLIQKEFAQIKVLTIDGDQYDGIRVSQTKDEIVLRNVAQPKPIRISMEDIEDPETDIKEIELSIMPEQLVRLLKNRQEFNDLMKYIIETRKR